MSKRPSPETIASVLALGGSLKLSEETGWLGEPEGYLVELRIPLSWAEVQAVHEARKIAAEERAAEHERRVKAAKKRHKADDLLF